MEVGLGGEVHAVGAGLADFLPHRSPGEAGDEGDAGRHRLMREYRGGGWAWG